MVTSATKEAEFVQGPAAVGAAVGASVDVTVGIAAVGVGTACVAVGGTGVAVGGVWQADAKTINPRLKKAIVFFISAPSIKIQIRIVCFYEQIAGR